MTSPKSAFTLVELSIVLVIIGLIVGGILTGQDLIHAAQIRAQVSQIEKLNNAVHTFQIKYNGIPGDLLYTQAQAFGLYTITYAPYIGNTGYGDGNGLITTGSGGCCQNYGEPVMFFRHLSDANLIDGNYGSLIDIAAQVSAINASNVFAFYPQAKIGAGASIQVGSPLDGFNYFALTNLTALWGGYSLGGSKNAITAQEAYAIDTKMDDGLPATGNITALDTSGNFFLAANDWTGVSGNSNCVSSGVNAYAVKKTTQDCSLRFKFQ